MTIDELNEAITDGEIDEVIRVSEARQCKALGRIADDVVQRGGVKIVLLAGGSSAGKTTTAMRLCTQLRVNGLKAMHLSTDDYFVGDARNPRDENGEFDYECIGCVDRERLATDLNALRSGEKVHLRKFDFVRHDGFDDARETRLASDGVIVLEGIHALNPLLTEGVDEGCKYRLFIEPKTQPEVFATTRLSSRDARLLRRMVRDNCFRKISPLETFKMWNKVIAGEDKWINPFRPLADAEFDSSLEYELAVLKPYAAGLLARYRKELGDYPKAHLLEEILLMVEATDSTKVPGDSILRETIGGSLLDYGE